MRLRVAIVAMSLLAVVPGISSALGLGPIQLKSGLNAPLNAEIELTATPEELASLKAQIASRETFSRYGLDYPSFLTGIQVKVIRATDGRDVIQLNSSAPMVEPFATLLVEATWARGRNLREYTVLFDPPVFAPEGAREAPVAAPVTGAGDRSGVVARQPAAAPAPVSATPTATPRSSSADGSYVVRKGDSLSGITQQQYGSTSNDRAMIAIYRGNPAAFGGNINELHAGAVLRLPDEAAVSAVDPGEAAAEVRRQSAAWSPGRTSDGAATDPRLRLVPPAAGGGSAGSAGNAENQALRDRVTRLESDLAESRRLLELRNAELARLQGATAPKTPVSQPPEVVAPVAPVAATPPASNEPIAETPPEVAPPAPVAKPKPVVAAPKPVAGPSLVDRLKALWIIPVGLLVLAALLLGLRAMRRRRTNSFESAFGTFGSAPNASRDLSSDTFPMRKPVLSQDDRSILVEESGTRERPAFASEAPRTVDFDDADQSVTGTGLDTGTALDQGDPLAEADFHMAYGLYDQAADLVRLAIEREPSRRDLKLKLLEVFFVWGNKDQFLQTARDLASSRDVAEPGEWEKILIMGKQLAPEDALFSATYSGPGPSAVDLNLEGGQNHIDFDLHGEPVEFTPDGMDLDLGSGGPDPLEGTARLDFSLDDPARGGDGLSRTATTRQMVQPGFGEETSTQRIAAPEGQEGPTVEQPQLHDGGTLRQKIDAQTQFIANDQTAELALDDLGLDLGRLDTTRASLMDDSRMTRELASPDAPTLVAGLDETSRRMIAEAQEGLHPTQLLPLGDSTDDAAQTSRVPSLDFELNYDLDSSDATGKQGKLDDGDFLLDLDVGSRKPADGEHVQTQRLESPRATEVDALSAELEPVTMSEVGTKLDLARAYMDMGDPDGARNILNEVLQEGSVTQKQEAQRLIDSIPG
ncbi:MAG: FimV/HubP family polar landmark protein [Pseudomonadota bacterium]